MLQQSTPFSCAFTAPEHQGYSVWFSRFTGTYDLCQRKQVGAMCWETKTLSSHSSKEEAESALSADIPF